MRDKRDGESAVLEIDERQAHAIDGDRAFANHLFGQRLSAGEENKLPFTLTLALVDAADAVDVALNDMSAQPIADSERALEVDLRTGFEVAEIGELERLRAGLKRE